MEKYCDKKEETNNFKKTQVQTTAPLYFMNLKVDTSRRDSEPT